MKRISILLLSALLLTCCATNKQKATTEHPDFAYNATIYELNTRQFTPEGTFAAAQAELPRLKDLGVDIVWIMPIQPIGELERKGTLGSYYAIKDYCAFNPEFGTREDFEAFLTKAHELGMKVILDWVANHTAPDHAWTQNEGWHMRDSLGNLVVNYDWYDIAELNYDNNDMRQAMKTCLKWWVDSIGVDGFRCDVASEVPTDFWEDAMGEIRAYKPDLFTLAEAEAPDLNEKAFDMYYGWELHKLMNGVAQGKNTVDDLWNYFAKADTTFAPRAIRMNFTSNHDENSWNGTEFERMGEAAETFAAFTYMVPGMPLIYTGQEFGSDKRLRFFEKDTIFQNGRATQTPLYTKLSALRKANPALWSPEQGGAMQRLECANPAIFACVRQVEGNTVIGIFNLSGADADVELSTAELTGTYTNFGGESVDVGEKYTTHLGAWWWQILSK